MADLIDRQDLMDAIEYDCEDDTVYMKDLFRLINRQNAVDAEPVVRCKDCKHCLADEEYGRYWCNRMLGSIGVSATDFCSYGERKDRPATYHEDDHITTPGLLEDYCP